MSRRTGLLIIFVVVLVFIAIFIGPGLFVAGGPNLLADDNNNGSFEEGNYVNDPNEPIDNNSGCKAQCGGSSSLDKWQVFNESLGANQSCDNAKDAVCWVQGSPDTPTTFQLYAQDGHRFLDLTGFARRTPKQYGEVQQSIGNIQPGQSYELSFWIGSSSRFPPPPTPPGKTPEVGVSVNVVGAISDNPSFDAPVTTEVSHWELRSFRLKATYSNLTIRFAGIGVPGANGNGGDYIGLDNVSLRKVCFIVNAILNGCS